MQNFDRPYLSHSVGEFWRRWHISLSSWLRDYVYIPLGGSRKGRIRTYINLMITFLVSGLWHGAAGHFLMWGAVHGALLVAERMVRDLCERSQYCRVPTIRLLSVFCRPPALLPEKSGLLSNEAYRNTKPQLADSVSRLCTTLHIALTFVLVVIAWVFFRSDNISLAASALRKMTQVPQNIITIIRAIAGGKASFGAGFWGQYTLKSMTILGKCTLCMVIVASCDAVNRNSVWFCRASAIFRVRAVRWAAYYAVGVMLWTVMAQEVPSQFIYFQF